CGGLRGRVSKLLEESQRIEEIWLVVVVIVIISLRTVVLSSRVVILSNRDRNGFGFLRFYISERFCTRNNTSIWKGSVSIRSFCSNSGGFLLWLGIFVGKFLRKIELSLIEADGSLGFSGLGSILNIFWLQFLLDIFNEEFRSTSFN